MDVTDWAKQCDLWEIIKIFSESVSLQPGNDITGILASHNLHD